MVNHHRIQQRILWTSSFIFCHRNSRTQPVLFRSVHFQTIELDVILISKDKWFYMVIITLRSLLYFLDMKIGSFLSMRYFYFDGSFFIFFFLVKFLPGFESYPCNYFFCGLSSGINELSINV